MTNFDYRIPDDMAAEVLAEATRLHAETSKGYSFADLEQACSEAQIPPHIVRQAIKNVEDKRLREQTKRQQLQEHIKQQVKRGMFAGIAILIPAVAISSIFLFRSQLKPVVSGLVSSFNLHQQKSNAQLPTLTVKEGKLEYLTDPKGLSIAVRDTNAYSSSGTGVEAIISTDGYRPSGKAGGSRQEAEGKNSFIQSLLSCPIGFKTPPSTGVSPIGWGLNPHPIEPSALCPLPSAFFKKVFLLH